MIAITEEAKQAIIKKVLSKNGQTLAEIALANNIGRSTLHRWVNCFKSEGKNEAPTGAAISLSERFKHLQATLGQESSIVGAYCRKHGLYPHQLAQWETDFMTTSIQTHTQERSVELKELRAENKVLKRMIARKDKVLAETVALLILKKKAAHIWGEAEDD